MKNKQIEEIKDCIDSLYGCDCAYYGIDGLAIASELYAKGYRKIHDDHQRQCTCYALGCQMAEELESKVASEFIAVVDSMLNLVCEMTGLELKVFGKYAELKKKYTEGEG